MRKHTLKTEHFVNCFGDSKMKEKYIDWVWETLQAGYAKIGGLKGVSQDDLMADNVGWKIKKTGGIPRAVNIYKMIGGTRKALCGSCTQDADGKAAMIQLLKDDIAQIDRQVWTELSGAPQHWEEKFGGKPIPFEIAKMILSSMGKDDAEPVEGDPYSYTRMIGGEIHQKKMFGNIKDVNAICEEYELIRSMTKPLLPRLPPPARLPPPPEGTENDEFEEKPEEKGDEMVAETMTYSELKKIIFESLNIRK